MNYRRPVQGTSIGIIVLDTSFERLPGDIASVHTWNFPVQFAVARNVRPQDVIGCDAAAALDVFYRAIDELVTLGVEAITTSCGYLAAVHPQLRRYSPVPLVSSSLQQIPLALCLLPENRTVGVIVSDRAALLDIHFLNVGAPIGLPLGELPENGIIRSNMRNNATGVSYAEQEGEVLTVVERMLSETPSIGAIVSECANLPPYSSAIARTFGIPVYDIVTLVEWMHAGLHPRSFNQERR